MCQHCKTAPCAKACTSGAIAKDAQAGIVRIDKDKCTGSMKCIEQCPYKVIHFDAKSKTAHKRFLCSHSVTHGLKPVCVETCLTNALSFGEKELLLMRAEAAGKKRIKKRSAQSILYVQS